MNELKMAREVKKVMKYGISKQIAREIVETAMSVSKDDLDKAIQYALTLQYGFKFAK